MLGCGGPGTGLWAHCGTQASDMGWAGSPCRTARANNPGTVLTFVLPTEQSHLGKIEELLGGGKSQGQASPMMP